MDAIEDLLRQARSRAGMSRAELSRRSATTRAALLEYEKGIRSPRFDTLLRILDATGTMITITLPPGPSSSEAQSSTSLALAATHLDENDATNWRLLISDFVANDFVPATTEERAVMLESCPAVSAGPRWDAFVRGLAEHLCFHAELVLPRWLADDNSVLPAFWWPVHGDLPSQRVAAAAWSPASFRRRRILIDRRELPIVTR